MQEQSNTVQESYDQVAAEYTTRISHELEHKPFDRALLDRFADSVHGQGPVADIGCGPGHIAAYLHQQDVQVLGLDLSPAMVEQARQLNPTVEFRQADMAALPIEDEALSGIVAFYSLIHIPRPRLVAVLREFRRVLRPSGLLLLSFHQGQEIRHFDEWWGHNVSLDFFFFEPSEMQNYLQQAGFTLEETLERPPYEDVEAPTHRVYILARKPGGSKCP